MHVYSLKKEKAWIVNRYSSWLLYNSSWKVILGIISFGYDNNTSGTFEAVVISSGTVVSAGKLTDFGMKVSSKRPVPFGVTIPPETLGPFREIVSSRMLSACAMIVPSRTPAPFGVIVPFRTLAPLRAIVSSKTLAPFEHVVPSRASFILVLCNFTPKLNRAELDSLDSTWYHNGWLNAQIVNTQVVWLREWKSRGTLVFSF